MESPWDGGTKVCSKGPGYMTKMVAMPIYGKKPQIFPYIDGVVFYNRSVPRGIAHIKDLSYLSDYDVIMRMECLNRRGP